jgi:hypothetical protein
LPFVPYFRVSFLTWRYSAELIPPTKQALQYLWSESDLLKVRVLDISATDSKVYILSPCRDGATGDVITLDKTASGWQIRNNSWYTVFSDCGSAEGNTFPPYPEARSF